MKIREIITLTFILEIVIVVGLLFLTYLLNTYPRYYEAYNNFFGVIAIKDYGTIVLRALWLIPIIFILLFISDDKEDLTT